MREIKFRMWSAYHKCFFYWGFVEELGRLIFKGLPDSSMDPLSMAEMRERSEQYIGLSDRNNEEIYENDIVMANGFMCWVEWSGINAWWCLVQLGNPNTPYTGGIKGQDIWRCTVVGNIHENPELVKKT